MAGVSIAVVTGLVAYVLSPTTYRLEIVVKATRIASSDVVVYGTVESTDGDGLPGAEVEIRSAPPAGPELGAVTDDDGNWRLEPAAGRLTVTIKYRSGDRNATGKTRFDAEPGWHYEIDARIREHGGFFVFPGVAY